MSDTSLDLVSQWQGGDQAAAAQLFQRYAQRLIVLVQRHFSPELNNRLDPEDVVQSACFSFFTGVRQGRFVLRQSSDLWGLLAAMTLHKLHDQADRHKAGKRSVRRQQSFGRENSLADMQTRLLQREPSPEDAALAADMLETVLRAFQPLQRRMIELRLQGFELEEIAAATHRSERTVRRIVERAKQILAQVCG